MLSFTPARRWTPYRGKDAHSPLVWLQSKNSWGWVYPTDRSYRHWVENALFAVSLLGWGNDYCAWSSLPKSEQRLLYLGYLLGLIFHGQTHSERAARKILATALALG